MKRLGEKVQHKDFIVGITVVEVIVFAVITIIHVGNVPSSAGWIPTGLFDQLGLLFLMVLHTILVPRIASVVLKTRTAGPRIAYLVFLLCCVLGMSASLLYTLVVWVW